MSIYFAPVYLYLTSVFLRIIVMLLKIVQLVTIRNRGESPTSSLPLRKWMQCKFSLPGLPASSPNSSEMVSICVASSPQKKDVCSM